jgi:hypothetical protein
MNHPQFASADDEPAHPEPARTRGWSWKLPPDLVVPVSEKRNHVFYVGEPVVFDLAAAATSYEVRNYYGDIVARGRAGATLPQLPSASTLSMLSRIDWFTYRGLEPL